MVRSSDNKPKATEIFMKSEDLLKQARKVATKNSATNSGGL